MKSEEVPKFSFSSGPNLLSLLGRGLLVTAAVYLSTKEPSIAVALAYISRPTAFLVQVSV